MPGIIPMTGATTTIDAELSARWAKWLTDAPSPRGNADDQRHVDRLLAEFERAPTRSVLIKVLVGEWLQEVSRQIVGVDQADAIVNDLRAAGRIVDVVPIESPGIASVVIIEKSRLRNLYELCRDNLVLRCFIATKLEFACRGAQGGTALAGLWKWRKVFWTCLMDGKPPRKRRPPNQ
jgi:hypothetical protein